MDDAKQLKQLFPAFVPLCAHLAFYLNTSRQYLGHSSCDSSMYQVRLLALLYSIKLIGSSSVWMVNAFKADTNTGAGGQPIYIYANQPAYAPAPVEPAPAPVEAAAEEEASGKRYKQVCSLV